jgi:hypothetical protein
MALGRARRKKKRGRGKRAAAARLAVGALAAVKGRRALSWVSLTRAHTRTPFTYIYETGASTTNTIRTNLRPPAAQGRESARVEREREREKSFLF